MKLTKTLADSAEYEGRRLSSGWSRCVCWDDEVPGFGLRVYPSGKKAFVVSYRARGLKRQGTVGSYGKLTVQQARKRAKKMLAGVLDGADPVEEKREARQAATLADLAERYLEVHHGSLRLYACLPAVVRMPPYTFTHASLHSRPDVPGFSGLPAPPV